MKYIGYAKTGEVFSASNLEKFFNDFMTREQALLDGILVELTGYQKGEFKCILRKKNFETGLFEFKALTRRQWRQVKELKEQHGWEIRKEFDYKTTYDEYPFAGQVKNEDVEK